MMDSMPLPDRRAAGMGVIGFLTAAAIGCGASQPQRRVTKDMTQTGQIIWRAARVERSGASVTAFFLDPILGMMDLNFHQVDERGLANMRASGPGAVASLIVAPNNTVAKVQSAIQLLSTRGEYQEIEITIGTP